MDLDVVAAHDDEAHTAAAAAAAAVVAGAVDRVGAIGRRAPVAAIAAIAIDPSSQGDRSAGQAIHATFAGQGVTSAATATAIGRESCGSSHVEDRGLQPDIAAAAPTAAAAARADRAIRAAPALTTGLDGRGHLQGVLSRDLDGPAACTTGPGATTAIAITASAAIAPAAYFVGGYRHRHAAIAAIAARLAGRATIAAVTTGRPEAAAAAATTTDIVLGPIGDGLRRTSPRIGTCSSPAIGTATDIDSPIEDGRIPHRDDERPAPDHPHRTTLGQLQALQRHQPGIIDSRALVVDGRTGWAEQLAIVGGQYIHARFVERQHARVGGGQAARVEMGMVGRPSRAGSSIGAPVDIDRDTVRVALHIELATQRDDRRKN